MVTPKAALSEPKLTSIDSGNYVTQPVAEIAKKLAPASIESLANVWIIKVLSIAVQETTLNWFVNLKMREH